MIMYQIFNVDYTSEIDVATVYMAINFFCMLVLASRPNTQAHS